MFKNDVTKFRVYVQTKDGIIEHEFTWATDATRFISTLPDGTLYTHRLVGESKPIDPSELIMKRGKP